MERKQKEESVYQYSYWMDTLGMGGSRREAPGSHRQNARLT